MTDYVQDDGFMIEQKNFRVGVHAQCYCGRIFTIEDFRKMGKLCTSCKTAIITKGDYVVGGVRIRYIGPPVEGLSPDP